MCVKFHRGTARRLVNGDRPETSMTLRWRTALIVPILLALFSLGVGFFQFFCREGGGAEWLTAAGGFGLIAFAVVQLWLEHKREADRQEAARAKVKPVARLARRSCERAVIDSDGKALNQWLGDWYRPSGQDLPPPIDVLQQLLRETVTFAAEAGGTAVRAADTAFDAFIAAADVINELWRKLYGPQEDKALRANNPRGRVAADHLARAARELEALAPRGAHEPEIPPRPKFLHEN